MRPTTQSSIEVEVLLPVHNEAQSVERTLDEIHRVVSGTANMRFIITEDGSNDGTPQILEHLAARYPMKLMSSPTRKGYSRAVIDGLNALEAPYVLCLDADGQCDPADFATFWAKRKCANVLIGWRVDRQDTQLRKLLSGTFRLYYRALFRIPLHDPSCPFVLAPRRVVMDVFPHVGVLTQGFWWEFTARVRAHGYTIEELPITHRARAAGQTQVYRLRNLPGIGWSHFRGLLRVWQDCRRIAAQHGEMGTEGL